jgi:type II secretory pathway predicted ATPase ExeA
MTPRKHKAEANNLARFLARIGVSARALTRACGLAAHHPMLKAIHRAIITDDLRLDIETVIELSGHKVPANLWAGFTIQRKRTLRPLHCSTVISGDTAIHRERETSRYLSAQTLNPKRKGLKLEPLTLNAMRRFGFEKDPFNNEMRTTDDMFLSAEHNACIQDMVRAAKRHDWLAVIGEHGSGKTQCYEVFRRQATHAFKIIKVKSLEKKEITGCSGELDEKIKMPARRETVARLALKLLCDMHKAGRRVVLVIEEGQLITNDCFRAMKSLRELDDTWDPPICILILAQREIMPRLDNPAIREVGNRVQRSYLRGLGNKTADYIRHKIERAGGNFDRLFSPELVKQIQKVCTDTLSGAKLGPYPMQLGILCTLLLNEADRMGDNKPTIELLDNIRIGGR